MDDLFAGRSGATVQEVAEILGVSDALVRGLLDDGELVAWRVGRRIVVSTKSVQQYLNEHPY